MKKMIIGFALVCFVAFGTFGVQSAIASADNMEIVKLQLDDDPDKNKKSKADGKDKKTGDKSKTGDCKDAKANCETKTKCCDTKCGDKKTTKKEGGGDKK